MSSRGDKKFVRHLVRRIESHAASVKDFWHAPLAFFIEEIFRPGLLVGAAYRGRGSRKNYWIAVLVELKGYRGKFKWLGATDGTEGEFWRNIAYNREPEGVQMDFRIHPVSRALRNGGDFRPPAFIRGLPTDLRGYLRSQFEGKITLPENYSELLQEEDHCAFRKGHVIEAMDVNNVSKVRPAEVVEVIGRRLRLKYHEPEPGEELYCWFHEESDHVQAPGWATLVGRPLISSPEYERTAALNPIMFDEPPVDDDYATLTHMRPILIELNFARALKEFPFRKGLKCEYIDPCVPGIRSGEIVNVLENLFLMIKPDLATADDDIDPVCLHAASGMVLYTGFAREFGLQGYLRPRNPRYEGDCLPRELFEGRFIPEHGYEAGQYLEATGVSGTNKIYLARIKRVVNHLLLIAFEGYDKREDQLLPIGSEDIYPLGWCEAHDLPLITPLVSSKTI